jgi:hypothetical protein
MGQNAFIISSWIASDRPTLVQSQGIVVVQQVGAVSF